MDAREEAFSKYIKKLSEKKIPDAELEQLVLQGWKSSIMIMGRGSDKSTSQLIKPFLEEDK